MLQSKLFSWPHCLYVLGGWSIGVYSGKKDQEILRIDSAVRSCCHWVQGPISLTVFRCQFKFDGKFVSLSPRLQQSDRYKVLYMTRQLCCRGMCKNLLRSDGQQWNYLKAKFASNLNYKQKNISDTGPYIAYYDVKHNNGKCRKTTSLWTIKNVLILWVSLVNFDSKWLLQSDHSVLVSAWLKVYWQLILGNDSFCHFVEISYMIIDDNYSNAHQGDNQAKISTRSASLYSVW